MKHLIRSIIQIFIYALIGFCFIALISLLCCYDDGDYGYYGNQCNAGDVICEDNKIKICNSDGYYETYQDCGAIMKQCSTLSYNCYGYVNNACCY